MKIQNKKTNESLTKISKYFKTNLQKKDSNQKRFDCFCFAENLEIIKNAKQKVKIKIAQKKLSRVRSKIIVQEFPHKAKKSKLFFHKIKKTFFGIVHFHNLKKAAAVISVMAILSNIYFQYLGLSPEARGASYSFAQTNWNGGTDGGLYPNHTNNQSGWTKYSSKDSGVAIVNSGNNINLSVQTNTASVDFSTEGDYIQEDASNGTDFDGGKVRLHNDDINIPTGGTITTSGNDTIHTFNSSGTFTIPNNRNVEFLIVAGGGGGGRRHGGGGGGGGVLYVSSSSVQAGSYPIVVGNGGQGGTSSNNPGNNGQNSSFNSFVAYGGGGGGNSLKGGDGGSGGGGGYTVSTAGSGTSGQGNNGGAGNTPSGYHGGGGGGAGAVGSQSSTDRGGNGGDGVAYSISGSSMYYGGGGGGGTYYAYGSSNSSGGNGGGGFGASGVAGSGMANTGGGGGGSGGTGGVPSDGTPGNGGSGVVILRYASSYNYLYPTSQAYYVTTSNNSQFNTSSWAHISSATFTQTTPANTDIKYLVSFDGRSSWKYWDGDSWEISNLDNLQTNGMNKTTIEGITQSQWESSGGFIAGSTSSVNFAADLSSSVNTSSPEIDTISFNYSYYPLSYSGAGNIDFSTEGNYIQENATSGTDFDSGKVRLNNYGDSYTKLLVHANGTGGSTTFTDTSLNNYSITANGILVSTTSPQFGTGSAYASGDGKKMNISDSGDWNFGTGDFTIDLWLKWGGTHSGIIRAGGASSGWMLVMDGPQSSNRGLILYNNGVAILQQGNSSGWSGAWHHLAIVRNGNSLKAYRDGSQLISTTYSGNINSDGTGLTIGAGSDNWGLYGYEDEIRISKGIARWTSDFSVPTFEYADFIYPTSQAYYVTTSNNSQFNTSSWAHISSATFTQTTPANTDIKYLVSFDGRSSWKYWDGDSWEISNLDNLQTNGMNKTTIEGITQSQWESSGGFIAMSGTLDFAADLNTSSSSATPELDNISINYIDSSSLISSPFNTENSENTIARIQWTEGLPSGTDAFFQVRTAPDNSGSPGTWTSWIGPDGTSGSYFTDSNGSESIPSVFQSGSDDQWIQYKLFLFTTNVVFSPVISDITLVYAVNAPPDFNSSYGTNGILISQVNDSGDLNFGKVQIQYSIRDVDTSSGSFTTNFITPSFEYSLNGTTNWTNISSSNMSWGTAPSGGDFGTYNGNITNKVLEGEHLIYVVFWNAKNDVSENFTSSTKIRVTINDNESTNNTATATSDVFTLDTKNPTLGAHPILVNGSLSSDNITFSATDDSALSMRVGLESDLSDGFWENFSSSKTVTLASDPDTVYVQFRDFYGNTSEILSATTPERPTDLMIQDTSNLLTIPENYRLFVAWKIATNPVPGFGFYHIYRSENSSGPWTNLIGSEPDRMVNYFGDNSVERDKNYYYKVKVEDADGNVSYISTETVNGNANGIQDAGEGGGGSESSPPVISSVQIISTDTTSAVITWTTNELATSTVGFSRNGEALFANETGINGYYTSHSVTLTGLLPNTQYHFQIKSADAIGNLATDNNGGSGYSFSTLPGPAISNVSVREVSNNQATISWRTTTNSNSYVIYSDSILSGNLENPIEIGNPDLVGGGSPHNHQQTIIGLSEGTRYYFLVKSTDSGNNTATDNNGGNFYEFTTTIDEESPQIYGISVPMISENSVAIYWNTDEPATSRVLYGASQGGPYTMTSETVTYNRSHYVIISSLNPDQRYYFIVRSRDINGNSADSEEESFITNKGPEYQHDPLSQISDISDPPAVVTDTKAVITFNTDQPAECVIEYGTGSENYSEVPVSENGYNTNHSMHITGLIFSTKYYYQITCEDNLETVVTALEKSFTTQVQSEGGTDSGDTVAPEISSIGAEIVTGESVVITWKTNENTNSLIKYGITNNYGSMAGNDLINSDKSNYTSNHSVSINNLIPGTKYYYVIISIDSAGNIGQSSEQTFTTKSPSSLSSINVASSALGQATITWLTSKNMTSVVYYGETNEYGSEKSSSAMTKNHEINISGLKQGILYHFRVQGEDAEKNVYSSGDYTFQPKSPPKIENLNISSVGEKEAKIAIKTDIPVDAIVSFQDTKNQENSGSQGSPALATQHNIELKNLTSGTTYSYTVKVTDEQGNQTESESGTFTTGKDENPPEINQVKTDSALTQNEKVQSIISWNTDEPATSVVFYKEGMNGEEKEINLGEVYSQNHMIVITSFKPGTVYHFKVKSVDEEGNERTSSDYALLTPKKRENIVQIIISNFQDIFGWAKL